MSEKIYWSDEELPHTIIEIEKAYESDGKWIVEGWASTSEIDSENLRMTKNALEDMAREYHEMTTVLHNHNRDEEIGAIVEAEVREKQANPKIWGCWVKTIISKTVPEIWRKIREKVLNGFSVRGKAKVREILEKGQTIQEALEFVAAELSVVSMRALRGATIEEVYVEKFLKNLLKQGGTKMAEERITMKDARDAISELIKDESLRDTVVKLLEGDDLEAVKKSVSKAITDVEERDTVMKVLDAVEMETKKEEPSQPTPDSLKETIKDLAEAERRALLSFIEDSLKKQEEGVTPEQIGVMNSLAGGLKALYERVKAAVAKEPAQALSDLKKIETTMKKLIESYPYPYPAAKKEEDEPSEEEESEKNLSETDDLTQFTEELAAVQKSLKDAVDRVRDEQLQTIGEQVKSLTEQVSGLTKTIQDEVPIRKGLDEWISKAEKEVKAKEEVENPFGEEYEKAGPHDKLSMVFAEKEKRGITIRRKEEKKV